MKQYVIDQLRGKDYERVKACLDDRLEAAAVEGVYCLRVPDALLTESQRGHDSCKPLYFAVELEPDRLVCELLVRTSERVRCDCMSYATEAQRNWFIETIDALFDHLEIRT
ncbi:MAG: hypothetical protein ACOWWM_21475 [Desulfobacterales bacterium]